MTTQQASWTCRGCGASYSTNDPDLIIGHVNDCNYVDGAGNPADLTVKWSQTHWYITLVPAAELAQLTGGRQPKSILGELDPDTEEDTALIDFLVDLAEQTGSTEIDSVDVSDIYPASRDEIRRPAPQPAGADPSQPNPLEVVPHILGTDPSLPHETQITHLANVLEFVTGTNREKAEDLAKMCFTQGRQAGFRQAMAVLRAQLATTETIDTDAIVEDFLQANGAPMHIEDGRWQQ